MHIEALDGFDDNASLAQYKLVAAFCSRSNLRSFSDGFSLGKLQTEPGVAQRQLAYRYRVLRDAYTKVDIVGCTVC